MCPTVKGTGYLKNKKIFIPLVSIENTSIKREKGHIKQAYAFK